MPHPTAAPIPATTPAQGKYPVPALPGYWRKPKAGRQRVKSQISACHQPPWMCPKSPVLVPGCLPLSLGWSPSNHRAASPAFLLPEWQLRSCSLQPKPWQEKRCLLQGQVRLALEISLLSRNRLRSQEPRAWHRLRVFCWRYLGVYWNCQLASP